MFLLPAKRIWQRVGNRQQVVMMPGKNVLNRLMPVLKLRER